VCKFKAQLATTKSSIWTGKPWQEQRFRRYTEHCHSYNNRDPRKNGESADGLAIKEGDGTGNIVRGARLWNNVDDGLDFWYVLFVLFKDIQ